MHLNHPAYNIYPLATLLKQVGGKCTPTGAWKLPIDHQPMIDAYSNIIDLEQDSICSVNLKCTVLRVTSGQNSITYQIPTLVIDYDLDNWTTIVSVTDDPDIMVASLSFDAGSLSVLEIIYRIYQEQQWYQGYNPDFNYIPWMPTVLKYCKTREGYLVIGRCERYKLAFLDDYLREGILSPTLKFPIIILFMSVITQRGSLGLKIVLFCVVILGNVF